MTVDVSMPPPLAEWEQRELHGLRLTGSDRELLESLANGKRLSFSEHGDGVTISARGWIGVVRLQACTIRVVPRLIDGHRSLVKMLAFLGHFSLLKQLDRDAPFLENDCDLFDLIALLLARECNRVAQRGPLADYEYQRDELALLRGRLDAKAQAIRKFGRVDTLVCEFDERVTDVPENRWLLRALRVARRRVEQQAVRDHVGRALGTWEEVCTDDSSEALPKPEFSRANAHYRSALSLAYLILDGTTASDLLTSGKVGGFSFMLSMPRLFEDFVARLVQSVVPVTCRVEPQRRERSVLWDVVNNESFKTVRPDLLVTSGDGKTCLPIDAKYKDYASESLGSSDLYQGAIYALAMARCRVPGQAPTCLMLYPVPRGGQLRQRVQVRLGGGALAEVDAHGIPVDDFLDPPATETPSLLWSGRVRELVASA